jgi:hypothetical protein
MMALYEWPHVTTLFGLFRTWQQPELCRRVDANIATDEETIVLSMLTSSLTSNRQVTGKTRVRESHHFLRGTRCGTL